MSWPFEHLHARTDINATPTGSNFGLLRIRCLFGGAHPPSAKNGQEEFVLGCGVCRPKPEEEAAAAVAASPR